METIVAANEGLNRRQVLEGIGLSALAVATAACESPTPARPSPMVPATPSGESKPTDELAPTGPHPNLAQSNDPQLRKLARHEHDLGRGFPEIMLFQNMPSNPDAARSAAAQLAPRLQGFGNHRITPHVVFEPSGLDLGTISPDVFRIYFAELKAQGVADEQVGIWTPFPEANTPQWGKEKTPGFGNTDPALFVRNFNAVAAALGQNFPEAKVAVLLDSKTYPSGDTNWTQGNYHSLAPYLNGLAPVDRFILQGFPWVGAANGPQRDERQYNPADFVRAGLAIEAAKILGGVPVMFNTGTFGSKYDREPGGRVMVSAAERQQILDGILTQAREVQAADLRVAVNVFSENKIYADEQTNWSYGSPPDLEALRSFIAGCDKAGIGVAIFDR